MDEVKLKPFAAYCRVSTERQKEEKTIEAQAREVKDWADKNGIAIIEWYKDDGWSGDMLARPELDRLRDDVDKGLWKGIICSDPDRLARRYSYQELVKDELIEKGVEVVCIHQAQAHTPEDKILQGFQGLFAEYERVKIGERMRRGKIHKAKNGKLIGHHAPYGYDYIYKTPEKDGYFQINDSEAEIVKMVFHWVADEGYSFRRVVKELYNLGIKPPKGKKDYWAKSSVARMLNRTDYIGISYYNRNEAVAPKNPIKIEKYKRIKKSSRRVRPKDEWYEIPVPAIIDKALFDKAKQKMTNNFLYNKRNKKFPYLLTQKIKCACGAKRVGDGVNGHHYYRCAARTYSYPIPVKCKYEGVNAEVLDAMVWNKLLKLLSNPSLIKSQAEKWSKKQLMAVDMPNDELDKKKNVLAKLVDEEGRYLKAYAAKIIDFEKYEESMKEVNAKKKVIESDIKNHREKLSPDQINLDSFEDICDTLYHSLKYATESEKQELIRDLIISIYVGERSKAEVNGRIPLLYQPQNIPYEPINRNYWIAQHR